MHYQFTSPSAQDTKTYHFQVKLNGFYLKLLHLKMFQLHVCQYFGDLRFSVTKNRNIRIPRYGQVCSGTYHTKEIPRYTGVPVFFPNPKSNCTLLFVKAVVHILNKAHDRMRTASKPSKTLLILI